LLGSVRPIDFVGVIKGYMLEVQAYCEAKLHFMVTSRATRSVSEGEARRLVEETLRLLRRPRGSGVEFARFPIYASYRGVYIGVSPDAIIYVEGAPSGLLEARIRSSLKHYDSDFLTLEVAGLLLEEALGRELSGMKLVLVVASDKSSLEEALQSTKVEPFKPQKGDAWVRIVRVYDRGAVEEKLSRMLEYWLGLRGYRPSPTPAKCGACEYGDSCPHRVLSTAGI